MPLLKKIEWKVRIEGPTLDSNGNIKRMKLSISDREGNHLGDLNFTETIVTWYKDEATLRPGKSFNKRDFRWNRFINMIETHIFAKKTAKRTNKQKA